MLVLNSVFAFIPSFSMVSINLSRENYDLVQYISVRLDFISSTHHSASTIFFVALGTGADARGL